MDKQQLLRDYKKQEDKMCLAQIIDKIEMSRTRGKIECTDFLDMYQVSLAESFLKKNQIQNYKLYGGYPDSERKILIAYPENYTEEMIAKNYSKFLKVVKIELTEEDKGKFTHRNYLGGIVKLGLKREKVGDIVVAEDGADIIVVSEFAEILKKELPTLTRFEKATITINEITEIRKKEIKIENDIVL